MKFDIRETASERIILCAHRGIFGGNIPCNTIASFDFAIAEGADMIELDLTKSLDGELFVFHPGMERRQFCRDVSIRKMNAADVRELKLCNVDGTPTVLGVNTLDEVLEHLKGRVFINVDKFGDCPADFSLRADGAQVIPTEHHPDTGIRDEAHFVLLAGPVFLSGGGEKIGAQFMQAHDEVSKEIRNPNMDAFKK